MNCKYYFCWLELSVCLLFCSFRKHLVFGKLVQGFDVLKKMERVDVEDGIPTVTVKIVNCGEFNEGKNYQTYRWLVIYFINVNYFLWDSLLTLSPFCKQQVDFLMRFPPFWVKFFVLSLNFPSNYHFACRKKKDK